MATGRGPDRIFGFGVGITWKSGGTEPTCTKSPPQSMKSARKRGPTTAADFSSGMSAPTSTTYDSAQSVTSTTAATKKACCSSVGERPTKPYVRSAKRREQMTCQNDSAAEREVK